MAYTINLYNTEILTVVEDGTIDQTTELKLVGRNYAGYGEIQNENFVFLLENFASANPPSRPLHGQVWYDAGRRKLKFWDGNRWRNTGGTEVAPEPPVGLSEGDLWWDNDDLQLYVFTGDEFILIGPQDAGDGVTQMQSRLIRDTDGILHSAIVCIINDVITYIWSGDPEYTIDQTDPANAIPNFDIVRPGVHQIHTPAITDGSTQTDFRFWGTARDTDKLGGFFAALYIKEIPGEVTQLFEGVDINNDYGIALGEEKNFKLYVEDSLLTCGPTWDYYGDTALVHNAQGDTIRFRVKTPFDVDINVIEIKPGELLPACCIDPPYYKAVNIGSEERPFDHIWANYFHGTADNAIELDGYKVEVDTPCVGTAWTIPVRDAGGNINAYNFQGVATKARYADLAEVYGTDQEHPIGTVMTIGTNEEYETEAYYENCVAAIGVVSEKPALLMNAEAEGQSLALKGRLPVRIIGPVNKGDKVYAVAGGCATASLDDIYPSGHEIGIALETNINTDEKLVECYLTL